MKTKYNTKYKLLKDTIDFPKGWIFSWEGGSRLYIPNKAKKSYDRENLEICDLYDVDYAKKQHAITKEKIETLKDWFIPFGEIKDYYPDFPSFENINKFLHLYLETRLIDSVDECRALNDLFNLPDWKSKLYNFIKNEYELEFLNKK